MGGGTRVAMFFSLVAAAVLDVPHPLGGLSLSSSSTYTGPFETVDKAAKKDVDPNGGNANEARSRRMREVEKRRRFRSGLQSRVGKTRKIKEKTTTGSCDCHYVSESVCLGQWCEPCWYLEWDWNYTVDYCNEQATCRTMDAREDQLAYHDNMWCLDFYEYLYLKLEHRFDQYEKHFLKSWIEETFVDSNSIDFAAADECTNVEGVAAPPCQLSIDFRNYLSKLTFLPGQLVEVASLPNDSGQKRIAKIVDFIRKGEIAIWRFKYFKEGEEPSPDPNSTIVGTLEDFDFGGYYDDVEDLSLYGNIGILGGCCDPIGNCGAEYFYAAYCYESGWTKANHEFMQIETDCSAITERDDCGDDLDPNEVCSWNYHSEKCVHLPVLDRVKPFWADSTSGERHYFPGDEKQKMLDMHNLFRCAHNASPLVWNVDMEDVAHNLNVSMCTAEDHAHIKYFQSDMDNCVDAGGGTRGGQTECGENLVQEHDSKASEEKGVYEWYREIFEAPAGLPKGPNDGMEKFHATTMLWSSAEKMACDSCQNGADKTIRCVYYPGGNVFDGSTMEYTAGELSNILTAKQIGQTCNYEIRRVHEWIKKQTDMWTRRADITVLEGIDDNFDADKHPANRSSQHMKLDLARTPTASDSSKEVEHDQLWQDVYSHTDLYDNYVTRASEYDFLHLDQLQVYNNILHMGHCGALDAKVDKDHEHDSYRECEALVSDSNSHNYLCFAEYRTGYTAECIPSSEASAVTWEKTLQSPEHFSQLKVALGENMDDDEIISRAKEEIEFMMYDTHANEADVIRSLIAEGFNFETATVQLHDHNTLIKDVLGLLGDEYGWEAVSGWVRILEHGSSSQNGSVLYYINNLTQAKDDYLTVREEKTKNLSGYTEEEVQAALSRAAYDAELAADLLACMANAEQAACESAGCLWEEIAVIKDACVPETYAATYEGERTGVTTTEL